MEVCLSTILPTPTPTHHSTTYLTPPLTPLLPCGPTWRNVFVGATFFSPFRLPTLAPSLVPSLALSASVALFCTQVRSLAAFCALTQSLSLVLTRAWALWRVFFVKFTSSWDVYLCGCPFLRYMRLFYTYCDEAQGKAKQSKPKSKAKRSEEKSRRRN